MPESHIKTRVRPSKASLLPTGVDITASHLDRKGGPSRRPQGVSDPQPWTPPNTHPQTLPPHPHPRSDCRRPGRHSCPPHTHTHTPLRRAHPSTPLLGGTFPRGGPPSPPHLTRALQWDPGASRTGPPSGSLSTLGSAASRAAPTPHSSPHNTPAAEIVGTLQTHTHTHPSAGNGTVWSTPAPSGSRLPPLPPPHPRGWCAHPGLPPGGRMVLPASPQLSRNWVPPRPLQWRGPARHLPHTRPHPPPHRPGNGRVQPATPPRSLTPGVRTMAGRPGSPLPLARLPPPSGASVRLPPQRRFPACYPRTGGLRPGSAPVWHRRPPLRKPSPPLPRRRRPTGLTRRRRHLGLTTRRGGVRPRRALCCCRRRHLGLVTRPRRRRAGRWPGGAGSRPSPRPELAVAAVGMGTQWDSGVWPPGPSSAPANTQLRHQLQAEPAGQRWGTWQRRASCGEKEKGGENKAGLVPLRFTLGRPCCVNYQDPPSEKPVLLSWFSLANH